ncbi:hypothetical protein HELRODRAFT_175980 [Helobdella robusta]|uniref:Uncharacterized protein n=1 Tax=Helobdella robusta TaxID=6412 RepID=T1F9Z8_HELRO|nr:hypothetical protein HELRODRAFT_175980 [Helobdella robusta]ESO00159.1 hypothetical protein HELRODRAFT_175980 [Helobdella robusta]
MSSGSRYCCTKCTIKVPSKDVLSCTCCKTFVHNKCETNDDILDILKSVKKHLTGDVSEKNVIKIMRLGRKCETVVRPILIKLDCVLLRDSIMRNVYKFKSLKEFSHVGLNYDLTKDQRQEFKSFVDKAKVMEREENNQNFLFRVRGQVGRWKIVKIQKKPVLI